MVILTVDTWPTKIFRNISLEYVSEEFGVYGGTEIKRFMYGKETSMF